MLFHRRKDPIGRIALMRSKARTARQYVRHLDRISSLTVPKSRVLWAWIKVRRSEQVYGSQHITREARFSFRPDDIVHRLVTVDVMADRSGIEIVL